MCYYANDNKYEEYAKIYKSLRKSETTQKKNEGK